MSTKQTKVPHQAGIHYKSRREQLFRLYPDVKHYWDMMNSTGSPTARRAANKIIEVFTDLFGRILDEYNNLVRKTGGIGSLDINMDDYIKKRLTIQYNFPIHINKYANYPSRANANYIREQNNLDPQSSVNPNKFTYLYNNGDFRRRDSDIIGIMTQDGTKYYFKGLVSHNYPENTKHPFGSREYNTVKTFLFKLNNVAVNGNTLVTSNNSTSSNNTAKRGLNPKVVTKGNTRGTTSRSSSQPTVNQGIRNNINSNLSQLYVVNLNQAQQQNGNYNYSLPSRKITVNNTTPDPIIGENVDIDGIVKNLLERDPDYILDLIDNSFKTQDFIPQLGIEQEPEELVTSSRMNMNRRDVRKYLQSVGLNPYDYGALLRRLLRKYFNGELSEDEISPTVKYLYNYGR